MWFVGLAISFVGLLWIGSGAFGQSAEKKDRDYAISRGSVVVMVGLLVMFIGTPMLDGRMDRMRLGIDVIVAILLTGLIVAHFSQDRDEPG